MDTLNKRFKRAAMDRSKEQQKAAGLRVKPAMTTNAPAMTERAPAMTKSAPAMTTNARAMTKARAMTRKSAMMVLLLLFAALPSSLQALTINVDPLLTGINGKYNTSNADPAFVRAGNQLTIRVQATLTNSANSNDNWGCTSFTINGVTRYYNHANSRILWPTRITPARATGANGDFPIIVTAPDGANGTVYPVTIGFYSNNRASGINGACNGTKHLTEYTAYIKLTQAQRNIDVTFRSSRNLKGDMKVIGNTAVCVPTPNLGQGDNTNYGDKSRLNGNPESTCLSPQVSRNTTTRATEDDDLMYAFVKDDGSLIASINQSNTMSVLDGLPPKAKIVEAKLYWIGRLANKKRAWNEFPYNAWGSASKCKNDRNDGSLYSACNSELSLGNINDLANANVLKILEDYVSGVELKVPGRGYVEVRPQFVYYSPSDNTQHYMANVDVTDLINPDQQEGNYFVRGINTKLHGYDLGTYGGWMLAVIYDNADDPDEVFRNISIFDGLRHITTNVSFYLEGFRTPLAGDVNATLFYLAGDGDGYETNDCMKFNFPTSGSSNTINTSCTQSATTGYGGKGVPVYIGGKGNRANAFSASTTYDGTPTAGNAATNTYGTPGHRGYTSNPSFDYSVGFDLHTYKLNNVLGHNQQKTLVTMNGNGADYYAPSFFGLSTMIHSPTISELVQEANLSSCTNSRNVKGRTMDYTLTFTNSGNEKAYRLDLIANFDESGMWEYLDLSKTRFDGIYKVVGATETPIAGASCGVTYGGLAVQCTLPDSIEMSVGEVFRMRYSVTFSDTAVFNDAMDSYKSGATMSYWNWVTKEKVDLDAKVKDPFILPAKDCNVASCADPKLATPVMGASGSDGYYILKPAQTVYGTLIDVMDPFEEPFLAYCKGIQAYQNSGTTGADRNESLLEVWLPLPMSDTEQTGAYSQPNSNFRFGTLATSVTAGDQSYYNQGHQRLMFDQAGMKNLVTNRDDGVITGFGTNAIYGLRLNMVDLSLHDSMYSGGFFTFANVNLIGTSFAIDRVNSKAISCGGLPLYGLYSQVVKTQSINSVNCTTEKLVFKQLTNYTYKASRTGAGFYESCSDTKTNVAGATDGLYMINPPDNKRIPFTTHCVMKDAAVSEPQYITTIFMGFDASNTYQPVSILNNTCVNLGLAFFVPTDARRYDNMRVFLTDRKNGTDGWGGYVGTVGDWTLGNSLGRYNGIFILDTTRKGTQLWPYGPFGVFMERSGGGAESWFPGQYGRGKNLHSSGRHSSNSHEPASDTMGNAGWKTIFDENTTYGGQIVNMMRAMKGLKEKNLDASWWISDGFCKNDSYGSGLEPNGDYDANTWLGYAYKPDGNILTCNDEQIANYSPVNLPSYNHQNYACVGLDSYFPINSRHLSGLNAWSDNDVENSKANPADGKIYTQVVNGNLDITIAGIEDNEGEKLNARVCVRVVAPAAGTPCFNNPAVCTNADYTESKTSWFAADFSEVDRKSIQISGLTEALRDARLEIKYVTDTEAGVSAATGAAYDAAGFRCDNEADIWSEFTDGAKKKYSADNFAIRPGAFSLQTAPSAPISKVVSGHDYDHGATGSDNLRLSVKVGEDNGYSIPSGGLTTDVNFTEPLGQPVVWAPASGDRFDVSLLKTAGVYDVNFTYNDVGQFRVRLTDSSWTAVDSGKLPPNIPECITEATDPTGLGLQYDWNAVPLGGRPEITDINNPAKYQVGCVVGGDRTVSTRYTGELDMVIRVIPHHFAVLDINFTVPSGVDIPSVSVAGARDKFTYYGTDVNVTYTAQAENERNGVTQNYTDGNYSHDVQIVYAFDPLGLSPERIDSNISIDFRYDNEVNSTAWQLGVGLDDKNMSYPRDYTKTLLPLNLDSRGTDFNVTLTDTVDPEVTGSGWWSVSPTDEITFIYGRANIHSVSTDNVNGDANITFTIDYYHPNTLGYGRLFNGKAPVSAARSSSGWRVVEQDRSTTASLIVIGSAAYGSPSTSATMILNGDSANIAGVWGPYPNPAKTRPRRFITHLSAPEYLWYMPYGQPYLPIETNTVTQANVENSRYCAQHQCGYIEFMVPSGSNFGGSGTDEGRYYQDDANTSRMPSRIGW